VKAVGLDLSLTSTGYALITDPDKPVPMWWSSTHGEKAPTSKVWVSTRNRLRTLADELLLEVHHQQPDLVVLEGPSFASKGGHPHDRSGLWWLVVDGLVGRGHRLAVVPPTVLKMYATGKGNASKDDVLLAVARRYTSAPISNNNEADAVALAAMGCRWLEQPVESSLPMTHLRAMTSAEWPAELVTLPV
jgi:Holliday junction resolvasome RuvABC endonuclease subunit